MDMKRICKQTGYFCVGTSVWLAEKTATASVVAGKATVKAIKTMTRKGEKYITEKKAAQEDALLDSNCPIAQETVPICS